MKIQPISYNYNTNKYAKSNAYLSDSGQNVNSYNGQTAYYMTYQPAFKMSKNLLLTAVMAAAPLLYGASNGSETNPQENNLPTYEEFVAILDTNGWDNYDKKKWTTAYKINPENTLRFYNMESKSHKKFRDKYIINPKKIYFKYPDAVQQIVDKEDKYGLRNMTFMDAIDIAEAARFEHGFSRLLELMNDYQRFSLLNRLCTLKYKDLAAVLENYPEDTSEYLDKRNELGDRRFDGQRTVEIIKAKTNGKYDPKVIDNIMDLQRGNKSYVFDKLPDEDTINCFKTNPQTTFLEICNQKIDDKKYISGADAAKIFNAYSKYPDETLYLLRLKSNTFNEGFRFTADEIEECGPFAAQLLKKAPNTFLHLVQFGEMENYNKEDCLNLSEICTIMNALRIKTPDGTIKYELTNRVSFDALDRMIEPLLSRKENRHIAKVLRAKLMDHHYILDTFNNCFNYPQVQNDKPIKEEHSEAYKLLRDAKDGAGARIFGDKIIGHLARNNYKYPNGLKRMLSLKDEYGNLRFKQKMDYYGDVARVFEKYPEISTEYANKKDSVGNYRYKGFTLVKIVDAITSGKYDPKVIDDIMDLQREDGSFVFNYLPEKDTINCFKNNPQKFREICNIRRTDIFGNTEYAVPGKKVAKILDAYMAYPEETTKLVRMYNIPYEVYTESIEKAISTDAPKLYRSAPKTFEILTRHTYNNDIKKVCELMQLMCTKDKEGNVQELSTEQLQKAIDMIHNKPNYIFNEGDGHYEVKNGPIDT